MKRSLKALGLALVVVFAMTAVAASAASASVFTSASPTGSTILTGHQVGINEFIITSGGKAVATTKCKSAAATGTITGTEVTEVTVHPTYGNEKKECEVSPFGEATVTTAGCNYVLSADLTNGMAPVNIECEAGKSIVIDGPLGCTITVPAQNGLNGVSYANEPETGKPMSVVVTATVTGISYTSSSACQLDGIPAKGTEADYNGSFTVEGFEDKEKVEGAQVDITWDK